MQKYRKNKQQTTLLIPLFYSCAAFTKTVCHKTKKEKSKKTSHILVAEA